MEPKIRLEAVQALRPYIATEDLQAFREEWREINLRDARDGTNEALDDALQDVEPDPDYE